MVMVMIMKMMVKKIVKEITMMITLLMMMMAMILRADDTNNGDDDNITLGMPETQKKSEHGVEELYVFYYSYLSNNLPFYAPPRFFFFPLPLSKSKIGVTNF